jgi:hypothetical protein
MKRLVEYGMGNEIGENSELFLGEVFVAYYIMYVDYLIILA